MTVEAIERLDVEKSAFDSTSKIKRLHKSFESTLAPVNDLYSRFRKSNEAIAEWLGSTDGKVFEWNHDILYGDIKDMYSGSQRGNSTLDLNKIHSWKRTGEYKEINTKQQAGYAAEVIGTTRENIISKHNGSGIITKRADDLPDLFKRNDQYVDKVRMNQNGDIVEKIQTKFIGSDASSCFSKLMSKKCDKYILEGNVDKMEVPKDFYFEIKETLIPAERAKLERQISYNEAKGKNDIVLSKKIKLDKLNKLDEMLEQSNVTMQEAIDGVLHPRRVTAKLFAKEVLPVAHETAFKSGLLASGLAFATSTVDNVSSFINGEITADEMIVDIVSETGAAGAIEYGSELISGTVSKALSASSSKFIQKIVGTGLPAAMVSFAVGSYDSISAFAKGEIDGNELAYELGENAASVIGAFGGTALGLTIGNVPGSIIGSIVGATIATEIYSTAVELCVDGKEAVLEKAEGYMKETADIFSNVLPEKVDEVNDSIKEYIKNVNLPIVSI